MTRVPLPDLLRFATAVAEQAGLATLTHFQTTLTIDTKSDDSPVTVADRAAERLIRARIEERFPGDTIIGEEFGESGVGARRWIIDPIDGTRSFVRGVPLYGVMIAVEEDDDAVVGVLHFPALRETVGAAIGSGCWWNGRRATVSSCARLETALICTTDLANIRQHPRADAFDVIRARAGMMRTWGDCYGYALVATGRAEAMFDPVLSIWDAAAIAPIVREAGGVVTDWAGVSTWRSGDLIACNAALADDIQSLMGTP